MFKQKLFFVMCLAVLYLVSSAFAVEPIGSVDIKRIQTPDNVNT